MTLLPLWAGLHVTSASAGGAERGSWANHDE
jgi:hypothetical protein